MLLAGSRLFEAIFNFLKNIFLLTKKYIFLSHYKNKKLKNKTTCESNGKCRCHWPFGMFSTLYF